MVSRTASGTGGGKGVGMFQYFWTNDTEIPPEMVTRNFSKTHIIWVIAVLILIPIALKHYQTRPPAARKRIKQILVILMTASEIASWIWKAAIGHYTLQFMLPFHLCGISIFIETAAVFAERNVLLKEFSYSLSMPSAFAAILTPGWYYPFVSFQYLQSVFLHTVLILIPILIVWGDGYRPDYRRLPQCFAMLLFFAGAAAAADMVLDGNYMFLCYVPDDTPLYFFQRWLGHPGYIFLEFLIMLVLWMILYLPWFLEEKKGRGRP
jgi:hypothetical integral membrane protein (TIGR02206 family)